MRTLACMAVVVAVVVTGCIGGGDDEPPAADPGARSAEGAEAAASEAFESYAAGDYGGFWDVWVPDAQELISREDYEKGMLECAPVGQGWPFDITNVRLSHERDRAVVEGRRTTRDLTFTYSFRYLDGQWRFDPRLDQRAAYERGYVGWLEFMRERGACSTATATWISVY